MLTRNEALQRGVEVELGAAVTRIAYAARAQGADVDRRSAGTVLVSYTAGKEARRIECDAVVVAVPLGVLKASLGSDGGERGAVATEEAEEKIAAGGQGGPGSMRFEPALPESKAAAIRAMGFGLLNKVVLTFDEAFWEAEEGGTDYFGVVAPALEGRSEEQRGRCRGAAFMFWRVGGSQERGQGGSLLALMAGKAAEDVEEMGDEEAVASAMRALRQVWGVRAVQPLSYTVTRWRENAYVRGAYSYVPPDASVSPHAIEELASAVEGRVFFAGEHTSASHPAQVSGALLSGLRAAGQVHFALGRVQAGTGSELEGAALVSAAQFAEGESAVEGGGGRRRLQKG